MSFLGKLIFASFSLHAFLFRKVAIFVNDKANEKFDFTYQSPVPIDVTDSSAFDDSSILFVFYV